MEMASLTQNLGFRTLNQSQIQLFLLTAESCMKHLPVIMLSYWLVCEC